MTVPMPAKVEAARHEAEQSGRTELLKFDPHQPRDSKGRWAKVPGGFVGVSPDTESKAWKDITKVIRSQGMGNCYEAAVTLMMNAHELGLHNPRVVQATVMGRAQLEGVRFGHSWLEADAQGMDHPQAGAVVFRNAYDWSSGNSVVMPDSLYNHLGQVEDAHEYTEEEAIREMVRTGHYGPWADGTPMAGSSDWGNSGPVG